MSEDPLRSKPHDPTLILLKSSYLIAEYIRDGEPKSDDASGTKARMTNALAALTSNMAADDFCETQSFDELSLRELCKDLTHNDKYELLLEMRLAEPFFPYQFKMTKTQDDKRMEQMREIAYRDLGMSRDSATEVNASIKNLNHGHASHLKTRLSNLGITDALWVAGGAVVVAGVLVVAAPIVAAAMPAAAGLSGAAAVSAGLASLGGGSLAAGGLGMAGGMWVLGTAGAAIGGVAGVTASVLSQNNGPQLIESSVLKVCVNFDLARRRFLERDPEDFAHALDEIQKSFHKANEEAQDLNGKGSQRLKDFARLDRTLTFAGNFITKSLNRGVES